MQNIYDNETFFKVYDGMRKEKKGVSANDLIEIPTIRKIIPDLTGKRVLELGCGYGENSSYFLDSGATYVLGTDISNNMINIAKNSNIDERVNFKVLAMENISDIKEKFDLVISSLAIHYVSDFDKLCHDVYHLLNDNGYFIFSQEHPIGTGTKLNRECNGKDDIDLGDKKYYLVSDYNRNGKRIVDWNNCKVVKYHRNFSYIINTLIKYFEIDEFIEPNPNDEVIQIKPKYKNQYDKPYFLFVKVHKK